MAHPQVPAINQTSQTHRLSRTTVSLLITSQYICIQATFLVPSLQTKIRSMQDHALIPNERHKSTSGRYPLKPSQIHPKTPVGKHQRVGPYWMMDQMEYPRRTTLVRTTVDTKHDTMAMATLSWCHLLEYRIIEDAHTTTSGRKNRYRMRGLIKFEYIERMDLTMSPVFH